jgi:hypothetical protein
VPRVANKHQQANRKYNLFLEPTKKHAASHTKWGRILFAGAERAERMGGKV